MSHPGNAGRLSLPVAGCRLIVVQDQTQPCPYRDCETARMPLNLPVGVVTPEITDELLARGFRRSGDFVYRAECPCCQACQPTRLDLNRFEFTASMRRVLRRGERELVSHWQHPRVDPERVSLFNLHRQARGLDRHDREIDAESYRSFLVSSCCDTWELAIEKNGMLSAVSIVDVGRVSMSAVYTHFHPALSPYSPGTYAILKQIERARELSLRYLYLGMYVAENRHLNYKARFRPQQRLIDDAWQDVASTPAERRAQDEAE